MSKFDIKNYFQSIYKINVALVNTRIQQGVLLFVCLFIVAIGIIVAIVTYQPAQLLLIDHCNMIGLNCILILSLISSLVGCILQRH